MKTKIPVKFLHIFLSFNLMLSNFYPFAFVFAAPPRISIPTAYAQEQQTGCYECGRRRVADDSAESGYSESDDESCKRDDLGNWEDLQRECTGCREARQVQRNSCTQGTRISMEGLEDAGCAWACPSCEWETYNSACTACGQRTYYQKKSCDENAHNTYEDSDPGCTAGCPRERRVLYEGGDCRGTHSIWVKRYSDDSVEVLADHGEVPPQCGAVSVGEQPPQDAITQPPDITPESNLLPSPTGPVSLLPPLEQTQTKTCPDWKPTNAFCLNGEFCTSMQDQCNLDYEKDNCRPDPGCAENKTCEEKAIVSCVTKQCDENLGEIVCLDDIQQTDCSVIRKRGERTGQPCGKNLLEQSGLQCQEKLLNGHVRQICNEDLGQYIWVEQWTDRNCGSDIEKYGTTVDPIKLCGKYNESSFAKSCPDLRLASCSQKRCDPDTEKYICQETWQTKDENGNCTPYLKDGSLTDEYCGTAFSVLLERQKAAVNTRVEGCFCTQGLINKIWVGKDCGEKQNQSCEAKAPETTPSDVKEEAATPDCEDTTNELLPIQYRSIAQKKADRDCARKIREEAMDNKPLTFQDIGNGAKGFLDAVGSVFGSFGSEVTKRIQDAGYRDQLRAESEAKQKAARALAAEQYDATQASVRIQEAGNSLAMQTSIMRTYLQNKAPGLLSSINPDSTEQIRQAFIQAMNKNCIDVTDTDGKLIFSGRTGSRKQVEGGSGDQCVKPDREKANEEILNLVSQGFYETGKAKQEIKDELKTMAGLRDSSGLADILNSGKGFDAQRVKNIIPGSNKFYDNSPSKLLEQALFYRGLFDNPLKGTKLSDEQSANLSVYIDELKKIVPRQEQVGQQETINFLAILPIDVGIGMLAKGGMSMVKNVGSKIAQPFKAVGQALHLGGEAARVGEQAAGNTVARSMEQLVADARNSVRNGIQLGPGEQLTEQQVRSQLTGQSDEVVEQTIKDLQKEGTLPEEEKIASLADEALTAVKGTELEGYRRIDDTDIISWLTSEKGLTNEQAKDSASRIITKLEQNNKGLAVERYEGGETAGLSLETNPTQPNHPPTSPVTLTDPQISSRDVVEIKVKENLGKQLSEDEIRKVREIVTQQHSAEDTYADMGTLMGGTYQKSPLDDRAAQVTEAFQKMTTDKDPQAAFSAFNSKPQGFIAIPAKNPSTEEVVRVYRGIERYNPNQPQAANVLRDGGVYASDIQAYLSGKLSLDDLAKKSRTYKNGYLALEVKNVRERMSEKGISEIQALTEVHVLYERNVGGISPWVSATTDPAASLEFASGRAAGFGPITEEGVSGVMVIDVPKSAVYDASRGFKSGLLGPGEIGIAGQIKSEWIRGFVPVGQLGNKEAFTKSLQELEQVLEKHAPSPPVPREGLLPKPLVNVAEQAEEVARAAQERLVQTAETVVDTANQALHDLSGGRLGTVTVKETGEKEAATVSVETALKRESDQPVIVNIAQNLETSAGKNTTTVVSKPPEKTPMILDDEAKAIASRLTEPEVKTLQLRENSLVVDMGFDPAHPEALDDGLTYLIRSGQKLQGNVRLIDKAGNIIDLEKATAPIPFGNIQKVFIDGTEYKPGRDAWLNPYLYKRSTAPHPVNVGFSTNVADIASLWETAATNPNGLPEFIQSKLGNDAYNEIASAVAFTKAHPELRSIAYSDIDPWELARLTSEKRQKHLSKLSPAFLGTGLFKTLEALIEKIARNEPLDDTDRLIITVLENRDLVMREGMIGTQTARIITDLNEQYAIANMAEDRILQQLIPSAAFVTHQSNFGQFIDTMKKRGVQMPDWFTPYRGNEFRYGIRLNGTKAHSGGGYFIDFLESPEDTAHILDHERVHNMDQTARDLGISVPASGKPTLPELPFEASEPYTEALSLLIQNKGDIKAALATNDISTMRYAPAAKVMLTVAQEVSDYSKDPLLGAELLLRGITDKGLGLINNHLTPLAKYYDNNLAKNGLSFAERMKPYSGRPTQFMVSLGTDVQGLPLAKVKQVINGINYDEANWADKGTAYSLVSFKNAKEAFLNNPINIIEGINSDSPFGQIFFNTVISNPESRQQIQALIDSFYIDYAKTLRDKIPDFDRAIQEALAAMGKTAMLNKPGNLASSPFRLIKEAFAQDIPSKQQISDLKTFENLVKKNLIKYKMEKDGVVDSDYINQIMATNIFVPQFKSTGDNSTFVTGASGTSDGIVQDNTYRVTIQSLPGVNLKAPSIVKVKDSTTVVAIATSKGAGKVEAINQQDTLPLQSSGKDDITTGSAKVSVVIFNDKNGNGKIDKDEKVLPWAGVKVELTKLNTEQSVSLEPGWNLITLTASPSEKMTASRLISEIAAQGGYATTVSTLVDGSWKTYVARGDKVFSNIDFILEPGKAYFVKSLQRSLFVFKGQQFDKPVNLKLASGWNAVGFPKTSKSYTASTLIDTINLKQILADALARFEAGLWDTFVKKSKEEYGNNFNIETNRGYILRMQQEGEFNP